VSRNNINSTLKSLESLYLKGDYDAAIQMQKEMGETFSPGHLYYNLGTLNLKKGDMAAGRYYLELSKKYNFNSSMVAHNLGVAKKSLEVSEIGTEDNSLNNIVNYGLEASGANYLTLTLLLALISLLIWRMRFVKKKVLILSLFLISLFPYGFYQFYISNINFAISLNVAEIYEGPSEIFSKIGSVRPGEKVLIGEENNGWLYITYPKSLNGWVNKTKLGILVDPIK
jgi:hypothetical protein